MGKRKKLPKVKKRDELSGDGGSHCPRCGLKEYIIYTNFATFDPVEYSSSGPWYGFKKGWRNPLRASCTGKPRRSWYGGPRGKGCGWEGPVNELVKWGSHP